MIAPNIGSRIEKADVLACRLVNGTDIASLLAVAYCTRQRQIFRGRRPAVFFADDVVHLTADINIVRVYQTLLADKFRPALDRAPQSRGNSANHATDDRGLSPWPDA